MSGDARIVSWSCDAVLDEVPVTDATITGSDRSDVDELLVRLASEGFAVTVLDG